MSYTAILRRFPQELQIPLLELIETIQQDMRAQLAVRREDFDALQGVVAELAEAQQRIEARLERLEAVVVELAEAQRRTEARLERLEAVVAELAEAQRRTEARVEELALMQKRTEATLQKVIIRQGRNTGRLLELTYREKAYAYFGKLLRRVQVVPLQDLEATLEAHLAEEEMEMLLPLDLLIRGQVRRSTVPAEIYLAVEVSAVVDSGDVERAQTRAQLLRKAGLVVVPAVVGEEANADAEQAARAGAVFVVEDGSKRYWEEALEAALNAR